MFILIRNDAREAKREIFTLIVVNPRPLFKPLRQERALCYTSLSELPLGKVEQLWLVWLISNFRKCGTVSKAARHDDRTTDRLLN